MESDQTEESEYEDDYIECRAWVHSTSRNSYEQIQKGIYKL